MRRKMRKFAEGDLIEDESDRGEVTAEQKQAGRDANSFNDAFKSARENGEKTFTWNGKKYGTALAKKEAPKAEKPEKTKEDPDAVREAYKAAGVMRGGSKSGKVDEGPSRPTSLPRDREKEKEAVKAVTSSMGPAAVAKGLNVAKEAASKLVAKQAAKEGAKRAEGAMGSGAMRGEVRGDELRYKKGGSVSSASKRADGCAIRGKTRA